MVRFLPQETTRRSSRFVEIAADEEEQGNMEPEDVRVWSSPGVANNHRQYADAFADIDPLHVFCLQHGTQPLLDSPADASRFEHAIARDHPSGSVVFINCRYPCIWQKAPLLAVCHQHYLFKNISLDQFLHRLAFFMIPAARCFTRYSCAQP